jgi:hypothetical protein
MAAASQPEPSAANSVRQRMTPWACRDTATKAVVA